jgi:Flp pilus assembly protein TadG
MGPIGWLKTVRCPRFISDERGAAAVELALVLPMLIGLLVGTFEIGLVGLVANNLDNTMQAVARKIRTGEADAPATAADFKSAICAGMFDSASSCQAKLAVSVRKFATFTDARAAAGDPPDNSFDPGTAGDVILVKATYQWPFFFPFFTIGYQQSGPMTVVLDSRTTFKNEPYE